MNYLGHKNPKDNSEQTLQDHLIGVSELAGKFASEFGEYEAGKLVGLYHDIGKYSEEFQRYIRQESKGKVDHSTAGARELFKKKSHVTLIAAFCIAGHHGGIPFISIPAPIQRDQKTFYARVTEKKIPKYDKYSIFTPPINEFNSRLLNRCNSIFSVMFCTRMLFSCLVDADFLDTESFMRKGKYNAESLQR